MTSEIIEKIHDVKINDRKVKLQDFSNYRHLKWTGEKYFTTRLDIKKLSARWVLQSLSIDIKHTSVSISKESLSKLKSNLNYFCDQFITVVEPWIHQSTPETKE